MKKADVRSQSWNIVSLLFHVIPPRGTWSLPAPVTLQSVSDSDVLGLPFTPVPAAFPREP